MLMCSGKKITREPPPVNVRENVVERSEEVCVRGMRMFMCVEKVHNIRVCSFYLFPLSILNFDTIGELFELFYVQACLHARMR